MAGKATEASYACMKDVLASELVEASKDMCEEVERISVLEIVDHAYGEPNVSAPSDPRRVEGQFSGAKKLR